MRRKILRLLLGFVAAAGMAALLPASRVSANPDVNCNQGEGPYYHSEPIMCNNNNFPGCQVGTLYCSWTCYQCENSPSGNGWCPAAVQCTPSYCGWPPYSTCCSGGSRCW